MKFNGKLIKSDCCGARVYEDGNCSACKEACGEENILDDLLEEDDISKFAAKQNRLGELSTPSG
jgi:hypothetical protein